MGKNYISFRQLYQENSKKMCRRPNYSLQIFVLFLAFFGGTLLDEMRVFEQLYYSKKSETTFIRSGKVYTFT